MLKINYICARYLLFAPLNPLSYLFVFVPREFKSIGINSINFFLYLLAFIWDLPVEVTSMRTE